MSALPWPFLVEPDLRAGLLATSVAASASEPTCPEVRFHLHAKVVAAVPAATGVGVPRDRLGVLSLSNGETDAHPLLVAIPRSASLRK
jgi:hypothetical protein